ncbi:hypothetical protein RI367_007907 [Sorochytrium milnesiophthora]
MAYSPLQTLGVAGLTVVVFVGSICSGVVSIVSLKNRATLRSNVNLTLTTALITGNFITSSLLTLLQVTKLYYCGGDQIGYWGCQMEGALISFGVDWSMTVATTIAVERYLVVVRGVRKPWDFWRWPLAAAAVTTVALSVFPATSASTAFVEQPSGLYCFVNIGAGRATSRLSRSLGLIIGPSSLLAISSMYFAIYHRVKHTVRATKDILKNGVLPSESELGHSPGALDSVLRPTEPRSSDIAEPSAGSSDEKQSFPRSNTGQLATSPGITITRSLMSWTKPREQQTGISKAERQAFRTSVGITACFAVQMAPYIVNLVLVMSGVYTACVWLDVVVAYCGSINLISDAAVVYLFNPRVRALVQDEMKQARDVLLRRW